MNIVYSSNDNYARHLAASMVSVMENNRDEDKIDFYILNVGLSDENIEKLTSVAEKYGRSFHAVDFRNIRDKFKNSEIPVYSFSIETYSRLFLAEALPDSENRAMWVDCDTAIIGNLHEAYYCEMGNNAISAVIDQANFGLELLCDDAEIPVGSYYNAGIFVANLDIWRKEKLAEKFVSYFLNREKTVAFPDQTLLNHVLHGRIYTLPLKYNLVTPSLFLSYKKMLSRWQAEFYSREEYCAAKKNPVIVHYTNFRPWKKWCLHPLKKYYRRYIKLTPYKDIPLENDGFFSTFKNLLPSLTAKIKNIFSR